MPSVSDSEVRPDAGVRRSPAAASASTPAPMRAWRSPWVIAWFALVASVLAINGVMVYLAIQSNPGLVVDDYYDRGQHYEKTLASRLAKDPGWSMQPEMPIDIKAGESRAIRFTLTDKAGQPVSADAVTFYAYRPSDVTRDFSLSMTLEGPGRYVVEASFPVMGMWDTLFAVRQGADEYTRGQRFMVGRP
jgi:nitrogen fixation protein FixH